MAGLADQILAIAIAKKQEGTTVIDDGTTFKGSVNYVSDLPASAEVGDSYIVKYAGDSGTEPYGYRYVYDGSGWVSMEVDRASADDVREIINTY